MQNVADQPIQSLIDRLGHEFTRPELLAQALTHKSFRNEQPSQANGDNERFEFLGDAVLDLALSELLMNRFSSDQEGSL
ncbi:MAG: ribonuclease III, partial [Bdellovibrionaceae bacterium]|nr:ribonuclease III [Pseudobdellovibrionaceae bacterium]